MSKTAGAQSGDWLWASSPAGRLSGLAATTTPDGQTWLATNYHDSAVFGQFQPVNPNWHTALIRYNSDGQVTGYIEMADGQPELHTVAIDRERNIYVKGTIYDTLRFNGQTYGVNGGSDLSGRRVGPAPLLLAPGETALDLSGLAPGLYHLRSEGFEPLRLTLLPH